MKEYYIPSLNDSTTFQLGRFKLKQVVYFFFCALNIAGVVVICFTQHYLLAIPFIGLAFGFLWFGLNAFKPYENTIEGLDKYLIAKLQFRFTKKKYLCMLYSGKE